MDLIMGCNLLIASQDFDSGGLGDDKGLDLAKVLLKDSL
ncbi:hypothetical protein SLEP1_g23976 [Rubroshorea leprosula]|uniref:Uncharacterized protein n=1 Tax=Rubroshorea leprosula TaxID=152421 RepID=A0AAV5JED0_9ROSI|nr:hypothetical protein SLEP1_g23976 [Rubroshorea leprosula]